MYNPFDNYWLAQDGRLYSSKQQALIKKNDKDFITWQEMGNSPTPWPQDEDGNQTNEELSIVLKSNGIEMFPRSLVDIQTSLKIKIDQDAERERLKYITDGVGQSMTYQEKVNQAAQYLKAYKAYQTSPENNPKPNDNEYLLLAAGLGIDGDTLLEAAETVTLAYTQWQYVGAMIEKIRLQAKDALDEAPTIEAAQAVYDGITWPQP